MEDPFWSVLRSLGGRSFFGFRRVMLRSACELETLLGPWRASCCLLAPNRDDWATILSRWRQILSRVAGLSANPERKRYDQCSMFRSALFGTLEFASGSQSQFGFCVDWSNDRLRFKMGSGCGVLVIPSPPRQSWRRCMSLWHVCVLWSGLRQRVPLIESSLCDSFPCTPAASGSFGHCSAHFGNQPVW